MEKERFDTLVIGPISLDQNIDCHGAERHEVGGAIVQSGIASARSGAKTAVFTKLCRADVDPAEVFADTGVQVFWKPSLKTTSIRNTYFTEDKEIRECLALGQCDSFFADELPDIDARVYHFAGLMYGDFDAALIRATEKRGKVALDVQCMLRHVEASGQMTFHDWTDKRTILPCVTFLKTDAAEAEALTGMIDREAAARQLYAWGVGEVMVTHNTEVLIYDGFRMHRCPIKARNLSGRTGRGDTTFAAYIAERAHADVPTALLFATALVSLKMETPGPFKGTREQIANYISEFYKQEAMEAMEAI